MTGFRLVALPAGGSRIDPGTDLPAEGLALTHVAGSGATMVEPDLARSPHRDLAGLAAAGMQTALIAPLQTARLVIGAIVLARRASTPFDEDDQLLARQAAAFVTSAIANLRSIAAFHRAEAVRHKADRLLARRASELDLLGRLLADDGDVDLGGFADRVATGFASLRGIELCRVTETDDTGTIRVLATAADGAARFWR